MRDRLSRERRWWNMSRIRGRQATPAARVCGARRSRDLLTKERRSWNMSRIRGKDTTPERIVRSLLHRMGYRFRLHVRIPVSLSSSNEERGEVRSRKPSTLNRHPSTRFVRPDLVLTKYKTVIFVHGCFWHRH